MDVTVHMHPGMGGLHHFVIKVHSNDPLLPEHEVALKVNFVE